MSCSETDCRSQGNRHRQDVALGRRVCSSKDLSPEAVYQAKRFLLDSIGCALGGYQQHDVKIALEVLDEIAGPGTATVIGTGKRIDPGLGLAGQCAHDSLHGLQRHLLEAGSVASFRHFPGGDRLLRARRQRRQRVDRRIGARPRVRDAPVRSGFSRNPRTRMAPRYLDRVRFADRRRARPALVMGADSARHRHLGQPPLHAGRGHRRQAHHDEEHRRSRWRRRAESSPRCWRKKVTPGPSTSSTAKKG